MMAFPVWFFAGVVLLLIVIIIKTLLLAATVEYKHKSEPWLSLLLLKAFYRVVARRQGRLYYSSEKRPDNPNIIHGDHPERVSIKKCRIDENKLKLYKNVCGCDDEIPLCYLESLFMTSLMIIVTGALFKLSPLGLIHIRQTIKIHTSLKDLVDDYFDLESRVKEYRIVDKGVEVDIVICVVNKLGICSWEGVITLLSRNSSTQNSGAVQNEKKDTPETDGGDPQETQIQLTVPEDTGYLYAQASGDWNPHHIYPWTARLLGYRQPIAHGMWILSKMVSKIKPERFDYPVFIDVVFKRPLFLPGEAIMKHSSSSTNKIDFSVTDNVSSAPHLIGSLRC